MSGVQDPPAEPAPAEPSADQAPPSDRFDGGRLASLLAGQGPLSSTDQAPPEQPNAQFAPRSEALPVAAAPMPVLSADATPAAPAAEQPAVTAPGYNFQPFMPQQPAGVPQQPALQPAVAGDDADAQRILQQSAQLQQQQVRDLRFRLGPATRSTRGATCPWSGAPCVQDPLPATAWSL